MMDDDDEDTQGWNEDLTVAEDSQVRSEGVKVERDIRKRMSTVVRHLQGMREGDNSGMDMEGDLGLMKVEEASYQEGEAWKMRQGMGCVNSMMEALALALASMVSAKQTQ